MTFVSEATRALYLVLLEAIERRIGDIVALPWTPELSRELDYLAGYEDEIWGELDAR